MTPLVALLTLLAAQPERVPSAPPSPAELARRDALTRYGLGLMLARDDRPVQAVKQFEEAAKSDPDCAEPLKPLVRLYADLGRHAAATRTAKKVLELEPHDAETARALGKLYYDAKRYADAAVAFQKVADSPQLKKDHAKRLGVLRDVARAREAAADWAGAEAALRGAAAITADHRDALIKSPAFDTGADVDRAAGNVREKLGDALAARKQYPAAVAAYAEAGKLFEKVGDRSGAARLQWNLSGVLSAEGKTDDALVQLGKFLAHKPGGVAPYERLADLLRRSGHANAVRGTLEKYASENPANDAIRWVLAAEVTRADARAGAAMFRELADKATDPVFFAMLVRSHREAKQFGPLLDLTDRLFVAARGDKGDESLERPVGAVERARSLSAALKADRALAPDLIRQASDDTRRGTPRGPDTWELVGGLAERDGRLAEAERLLRPAFDLPSAGQEVTSRFLTLLMKQKKWPELRDEASAAINRAGRGQRLLQPEVCLAIAQAEMGSPAGLAVIQRVVDDKVRAEGRPWARRQKAFVLNVLGRHQDAVRECQELLVEVQRDPSEVRQARIALANSYLMLKEYTKSEAELRKVLDEDPDDPLVLNNLGYYMADQGRNLAEAEQLIRRAIELDADDRRRAGDPDGESGTYLDSLGWVLFRRGQVAEARAVLEKVARMPEVTGDPVVWDHLGDVRFRAGDKLGAAEAWQKALDLYAGSHVGTQGGRLAEVERKLKLDR